MLGDGPHPGRDLPDHVPRGGQRPCPAAADQLRGLDGGRDAAEQHRRALLRGAQQRHLPHVRVGRVGVGVAAVAVGPDDDQAEVADGCEDRRPGADRGVHRAPADGQPAPVAFLRPGLGGEHRVPALAEHAAQRGVHPRDRAAVGQYHQRPASGGQGGGDRPGDLERPLRSGQCRPHGARGVPARQRGEEVRAVRVPLPAPGRRSTRRRQRPRRGLALGSGVARRDRELQHVRQRSRVAVGDGPAEPQQPRCQHLFGGQHPGQRGERAGVVRVVPPFDDVPVVQGAALAPPVRADPPAEADPDPDAGPGVLGHRLGDGVVEVLVEAEHALVDQDPGHRLPLRHDDPARSSRLRPAHRLPDERQLLPGPVRAAHAPKPSGPRRHGERSRPPRESPRRAATVRSTQPATAAFSASTRSVRSQVKSGSSRPKWP